MSLSNILSNHNNSNNSNKENDIFEAQLYSFDTKEENSSINYIFKVEINLGNNKIKELKIRSMEEVDEDISIFCNENNLPQEAIPSIKNLILDSLNKKILQCKFYIL